MIVFPASSHKYAEAFFMFYDLESVAVNPDEEMTVLKDKKDRTCRFCKRRFPQATFNSKAHILPELLGNKYLVSDFECDTCNKKLGRFDQHLDHFIGMTRALMRTQGKKGIPTLFSRDEKIRAGKETVLGVPMIKFGSTENDPGQIKYDPELKEFSVTYTKKPFVPFNVYRSLLKIGLCMIHPREVAVYEVGFRLLQAKKQLGAMNPNIYCVIRHSLPGNYEDCFAYLFRRKTGVDSVPPHTMVLFYKNVMLQIFLSFQLEYLTTMEGKSVDVPIFPPYFDGTGSDQWGSVVPQLLDFSSNESITEEERIGFGMQPVDEGQIAGINLATGKKAEGTYDPNRIVAFCLAPEGTVVQLPEDKGE